MSKYYNIRWRDSDQDKLRKAVKNFNAKLTRLEKQNPEIKNALPDRVSVKQMKELIDTRQDFNRELNSLQRFTRRGSEELVTIPDSDYNLKTTKWQKEEMTRRTSIINRKRKERYDAIKDVEMQSRGEKLGYTVGQAQESIGMGSIDRNSTAPLNAFTPKMNRSDLNAKFRTIMKESQSTYWEVREQIMKNTYIRTLEENYNSADISDIIEAIDGMDFKDFYQRFLSDAGKYEYAYPTGNKDDEDAYIEALRSTWIPNPGEDDV